MRSLVRPPPPALAPFVASLWWFDGAQGDRRERILPSGRGQLLVNLYEDEIRTYDRDGRAVVARSGGAALIGAYTAPVGIDTAEQRRIVGVGFRAGGAWPFLRIPVDALDHGGGPTHAELGDVWGRAGAVLRDRLLEAATPEATLDVLAAVLIEQLARPPELDPAVVYALRAFERGASVADVVDGTGLTRRTFLRRFRERVGMSPKRYACIRRFQRVLESVSLTEEAGSDLDWARVAQDCGYYDQAHLIHEFRTYAAMPPTAYRPSPPGMRNHVAL